MKEMPETFGPSEKDPAWPGDWDQEPLPPFMAPGTTNSTRGSTSKSSAPSAVAVLRVLGPYQVLRELGRGGMGIVYEAIEQPLDRRVALKVLPFSASTDKPLVDRLLHEARIVARLNHPHIVKIFGSGEVDGVHYIAFQLIDGGNLCPQVIQGSNSSELETTRIASRWDRLATLGRDVAEALQHAHDNGIIHRDVKPSNLLLDGSGKVWVADFGLAHATGVSQLTSTGDLLGTLRYMSPEQVIGQRGLVDARTDVYSLGVVLYELATQAPLFESEDRAALLRKILGDLPIPMRKANPALPRDLATIIDRAIAKLPSERYSSAGDLADDLGRYLKGHPIVARPPTVWDWCRYYAWKHRQLLSGVAATVFAILVGWSIVSQRHGSALQEQVDLLHKSQFELTRREWQTLITLGARTRLSPNPAQRSESLRSFQQASQLRPASSLQETERRQLRDELIATLAIPYAVNPVEVHEFTEEATTSYGTPAFDRIFRCRPDTSIVDVYRLTAAGLPGAIVRTIDTGLPFARVVIPAPSPSQAIVVVAVTPSTHWSGGVWDASTGKNFGMIPDCWSFAWSPEGEYLACLLSNQTVQVFRTADWTQVANWSIEVAPGEPLPTDFSWRPKTSQLAVVQGQSIRLMDAMTGDVQGRQTIGRLGVVSSDWNTSGRLLILGDQSGRISFWDIVRQDEYQLLPSRGRTSWRVPPSADLIATETVAEGTELWHVESGRSLTRLPGRPVTFDQHAQRLATCTATQWYLWSIEKSPIFRSIQPEMHLGQEILDAGISPEGRWLAVTSGPGLSLTDLRNGQEVSVPHTDCRSAQFALREKQPVLLVTDGQMTVNEYPFDSEKGVLGMPLRLYPTSTAPQQGVGLAEFSLSRRWIAMGSNQFPVVVDRETQRAFPLEPQLNLHRLSVSSDGKWAVGGLFQGRGINLWNVEQGKIVRVLWDTLPHSQSCFSEDRKWLAVSASRGIRVWDTATWDVVLSLPSLDTSDLPSPIAFSPDSQILVLCQNQSDLQIYSTSNWSELAVLKSPDSCFGGVARFSLDGQRLARVSQSLVQIWDVARLREELTSFGVNW